MKCFIILIAVMLSATTSFAQQSSLNGRPVSNQCFHISHLNIVTGKWESRYDKFDFQPSWSPEQLKKSGQGNNLPGELTESQKLMWIIRDINIVAKDAVIIDVPARGYAYERYFITTKFNIVGFNLKLLDKDYVRYCHAAPPVLNYSGLTSGSARYFGSLQP
jgi:hypothetical protein